MNKNQKQLRKEARDNNGQVMVPVKDYDKSCLDGKPTKHSFVSRIITTGKKAVNNKLAGATA